MNVPVSTEYMDFMMSVSFCVYCIVSHCQLSCCHGNVLISLCGWLIGDNLFNFSSIIRVLQYL